MRFGAPAQLGDAVAVPLALGLARVLGPRAVEPAALVLGVEHPAADQRLDPGGEVVGGGDDAAGCRGEGMVQARCSRWAAAFRPAPRPASRASTAACRSARPRCCRTGSRARRARACGSRCSAGARCAPCPAARTAGRAARGPAACRRPSRRPGRAARSWCCSTRKSVPGGKFGGCANAMASSSSGVQTLVGSRSRARRELGGIGVVVEAAAHLEQLGERDVRRRWGRR